MSQEENCWRTFRKYLSDPNIKEDVAKKVLNLAHQYGSKQKESIFLKRFYQALVRCFDERKPKEFMTCGKRFLYIIHQLLQRSQNKVYCHEISKEIVQYYLYFFSIIFKHSLHDFSKDLKLYRMKWANKISDRAFHALQDQIARKHKFNLNKGFSSENIEKIKKYHKKNGLTNEESDQYLGLEKKKAPDSLETQNNAKRPHNSSDQDSDDSDDSGYGSPQKKVKLTYGSYEAPYTSSTTYSNHSGLSYQHPNPPFYNESPGLMEPIGLKSEPYMNGGGYYESHIAGDSGRGNFHMGMNNGPNSQYFNNFTGYEPQTSIDPHNNKSSISNNQGGSNQGHPYDPRKIRQFSTTAEHSMFNNSTAFPNKSTLSSQTVYETNLPQSHFNYHQQSNMNMTMNKSTGTTGFDQSTSHQNKIQSPYDMMMNHSELTRNEIERSGMGSAKVEYHSQGYGSQGRYAPDRIDESHKGMVKYNLKDLLRCCRPQMANYDSMDLCHQCKQCGIVFQTKQIYEDHINTHFFAAVDSVVPSDLKNNTTNADSKQVLLTQQEWEQISDSSSNVKSNYVFEVPLEEIVTLMGNVKVSHGQMSSQQSQKEGSHNQLKIQEGDGKNPTTISNDEYYREKLCYFCNEKIETVWSETENSWMLQNCVKIQSQPQEHSKAFNRYRNQTDFKAAINIMHFDCFECFKSDESEESDEQERENLLEVTTDTVS